MDENAEELDMENVNDKSNTELSDNVPLALRKTPRSHAGLNMYTRMENNSMPPSPLNRTKDVVVKKRSLSASTHAVKENAVSPAAIPKKKRKIEGQDYDHFCWLCHKEGLIVRCQACPRSYHSKCLGYELKSQEDWVCPECEKILQGENVDTRSRSMTMITIEQLCNLLKFAVNRMKQQGDEAFIKPVPVEQFPKYTDYIVNPMDLSTLEKNIKKKMYGCTESFLADTKWILHNCIIFNGYQHRLTTGAKAVVKICKQEMNEIEVCPDCYLNAYTKKENWFCEPCREPHVLIWAKLKGFPFWPAKAMRIVNGNIDVRFFGAHDRAWIPVNQCFLLSQDIPTPMKNKKKGSFEQSMEELEIHVKKLEEKFGTFVYSPFRTRPDSENLHVNLKAMIPTLKDLTSKNDIVNIKRPQTFSSSLRSNEDVLNVDNTGSERGVPKQDLTTLNSKNKENNNLEAKPSGIFETSDDISQDLPEKELDIPTLDMTKISKPRLESIKNLESTIERIKEGVAEQSDEEGDKCSDDLVTFNDFEQVDEKNLINSEKNCESISNDQSLKTEDISMTDREVNSPSCEVTSTTNMSDLSVEVTAANLENDIQNSTLNLSPEKSSNVFSQKLDHITNESKEKYIVENLSEDAVISGESEEDKDENDDKAENTEELIPLTNETNSSVVLDLKMLNDSALQAEEESESLQRKSSVLESDNSLETVTELQKIKVDLIKNRSSEILISSNENYETEDLDEDEGEEQGREAGEEAFNENINECGERTDDNSPNQETDKLDDAAIQPPSEDKTSDSCLNENRDDEDDENVMDIDSEENNLVIDLGIRQGEIDTENKEESEKNTSHQFEGKETNQKTEKKSHHQSKNRNLNKERQGKSTSRAVRNTELGQSSESTPPYQKGPITVINISSSPPQMVPKPMPTLQPRPVSIAQASSVPSPSSPGPGCDMNKYSRKMMDFMRGTFEEMFRDMAKSGNLEASVKLLQLELEKLQWRHQQELAEIKHNTDLILLEMRASMESEKQRAIADVRRQCELEKQKSVEETKKKQWCAHCGKEAIFYCCWNTSYCDYPCQQAHWPQHMSTCAQSQGTNDTDAQEMPSVAPSSTGSINQINNFPNSTTIHRTVTHPQVPLEIAAPRRDNPLEFQMQELWQKQKENDTASMLKSHQVDKQQAKIHIPISSQGTTTLPGHYTPTLGPSIQYIPSNAVQVIPQTSSLANSAALQVQYVTNIPSQPHSLAMSSTTNTIPQFAGVAPAGAQQQNHRLLAPQQQQQPRNAMQMSNSVYPIIIQPSQLGINQNTPPSNGRLYPRGPYIPGKPYHIS